MLRKIPTNGISIPAATVLVVDDMASARFVVKTTLDRLGFDTLIAPDGEIALTVLHACHPDAIVTDLEMPGIDGEALVHALRNSEDPVLRDIPVIVCSSKVDEETLRKLRDLDVDAFVPKPVDVASLTRQALRLFALS